MSLLDRIKTVNTKVFDYIDTVPIDRVNTFIAGMFIAMVASYLFNILFVIWPVVFISVGKSLYILLTRGSKHFKIQDLRAAIYGGIVVQVLALLEFWMYEM